MEFVGMAGGATRDRFPTTCADGELRDVALSNRPSQGTRLRFPGLAPHLSRHGAQLAIADSVQRRHVAFEQEHSPRPSQRHSLPGREHTG